MNSPFFNHCQKNSVNIIELTLVDSMDVVEFEKLNDSVRQLLAGMTGQSWVLDFSRVSYVGSLVLGMIVNIRQMIKKDKGNLVLCGLSPGLDKMFRACSLQHLFHFTRSRQEAVDLLVG